MEISNKISLLVSAATGGPSIAAATFTGDFLPIALGAAVGVVTFLWSVRNTSDGQYVKSLHNRIQESQDEIKKNQEDHRDEVQKIQDGHYVEIQKIQSTLMGVQMDVKRQKITLDQIQQKLAVHSCPAPSDPTAKCRLPEILSSALSV